MRSSPDCARPTTRRALEALALAACLGSAAAGCQEQRARPSPTAADQPLQLSAEVLSPRTRDGTPAIAGRDLEVTVRAREPGRHLLGAGFLARRNNQQTVDSAAVFFRATSDTVIRFALRLPADLPDNTQVNIQGIAFGPQPRARVSAPQSVIVVRCPPGASWC